MSVYLTDRHTTSCLKDAVRMSGESSQRGFEGMERGFLRHFTALFYAADRASREHRGISTTDFEEGLEFAAGVERL
jgi:hypothetical protein